MRRILFTLLASGALFAAVPAVSLAHSGHHHRSHARTVRHHRIRHEHFAGSGSSTGTTAPSQNAGTVASFTNGILTITLADGSAVKGAVTNATEMECEAAASMQTMDRGPSGDGGDNGNNSGDNGDNAGDNDNGDDNGDVGDDNNNMCTTITPGMVVREANLTLTGSGAVWDKVELIGS
jgi:hypothetical protein